MQRTGAALLVITAMAIAGATYSYFSYSSPGGPASDNSSASVTSSECTPIPGHAGDSTSTITAAAGGWPGCDCALVASNTQGVLYVSTNANVGDDVWLAASLYDSGTVAFTIANSTGGVVLETAYCASSGGLGGVSSSTGISCRTDWNTAAPGESGGVAKVGAGAVTAGTYSVAATYTTGSPAVLEAKFTLGLAVASTTSTCTSSTSSSLASGGHIENAVTPNVYFNGSIYVGPTANFTVDPRSHAAILVNVSYPWNNIQPTPSQGSCIEFSFTTGPFPANSNVSTIPDWMHVSVSPSSVDIPYGSNRTVRLLVSVDDTAPNRSAASFELLVHYYDPASGQNVIGSYVMSIQA